MSELHDFTRTRISALTSTAFFFFRLQHVLVMQHVAERLEGPVAEAVHAKMLEKNAEHAVFVGKRRRELWYSGAIMARYVCVNFLLGYVLYR